MKEIPYGSCVSWRVPPEQNGFVEKIFGYLQNFFTGKPETHCSMIMSKYPEIGDYYEFEQSVTARINVFIDNPNCTVYDVLAKQGTKEFALEAIRQATYGEVYGIAQTFIFVLRWLLEKFGINGKRLWNPFGKLSVCSEAMWLYLASVAFIESWDDLKAYLDEWNPNTFHSGDAREVLDWMVNKDYAKII